MAKITIQIDTESEKTNVPTHAHEDGSKQVLSTLASRKIGLLSSIDLDSYLQDAFQSGVGSDVKVKDKQLKTGYNQNDINTNKKLLKNCAVIATAGGVVVFTAIAKQSDTQTFVCLVGDQPVTTGTNCRGGVTIHSWKSNGARVQYLTGTKGFSLSQIALYCNQNSDMNANEEADWNTKTSSTSRIIHFSGANTGTKANDSTAFATDFSSIPSTIKAIVISADPFFLQSMNSLMQAVYNWLSPDSTRFVVYPLQDYYNVGTPQPPSGQATFYGPDLVNAYKSLGSQARYVFDTGADAGFNSIGDVQYPPVP